MQSQSETVQPYALTPSRWLAQDGDTVVVYQGVTELTQVTLKTGEILRGRFGEFLHDEFIGRPFGSKSELQIFSRKGTGWVYFFALTPELWTVSLEHRTQILYTPDISMVLFGLDIHPGSVVVESGTGTGSLSHALLRAIQPHGHLYTYEFNKHRVDAVREEFMRNRVMDCATLEHRDVSQEGFDERLSQCVDAVFLDLPKPWDVLKHAAKVLKNSGHICLFSPCIEQVQQNCRSLEEHGFQSIKTIETLVKSFSVLTDTKKTPSPLLFFETADVPEGSQKKARKRARDASDRVADIQESSSKRTVRKRNRKGQAYIQTVGEDCTSHEKKENPLGVRSDQAGASQMVGKDRPPRKALPKNNPTEDMSLTLHHNPTLRGHTGYLTFAVWRHNS